MLINTSKPRITPRAARGDILSVRHIYSAGKELLVRPNVIGFEFFDYSFKLFARFPESLRR
ncbi:MAG: hypothetical protein AB8G99_02380 [Planctomycetaceae bacterium]